MKSHTIVSLILLTVFFLSVKLGVFTSPVLDSPDPSPVICQLDSDCVVAIRVDICGSCPEVTTQAHTQTTKGIEIYIPGRSYSELLPPMCAWVDPAPCPLPPAGAVCRSGKCQVTETVQETLDACPDCFVQAAQAAYQAGNSRHALELCTRATNQPYLNTSEPQYLCFSQLFNTALTANRLGEAEHICRQHMQRGLDDCLRAIALGWAKSNDQYAIALCNELDPADARHFGCVLDVALAIQNQDQNRAWEICAQLSVDDTILCRREIVK